MTNWLRRLWTRSPRASAHKTHNTRLNLESMEAREVPAALVGNGIALPLYTGSTDTAVEIVNPAVGTTFYTSFPGFRGPIAAAAGDVTGDGVPDAIVAAQVPGGLVGVFDGATGGFLVGGPVFPGFAGRVNVGTADLLGDGYAEILVSADAPGAPVRVFDLRDGLSESFSALPGVTGQISVTGADLNGDGRDEIVVGAGGPGVGGRVVALNADGSVFNPGGFAFPGFNGGISVAGGDVNGDGRDDIVVGAGPGSHGGEVKVFSGATGAVIDDFFPFGPVVNTGVNVYVADGDGDGVGDVFVALRGGYPALVGFSGKTGLPLALPTGGAGTYSDSGNTSGDTGFVPSGDVPPPPDIPAPPVTPPDTSYTPPDTSSDTSTDTTSSDTGDYSGYDYSGYDYSGYDPTSYDSTGSDYTDPGY